MKRKKRKTENKIATKKIERGKTRRKAEREKRKKKKEKKRTLQKTWLSRLRRGKKKRWHVHTNKGKGKTRKNGITLHTEKNNALMCLPLTHKHTHRGRKKHMQKSWVRQNTQEK